MQLSRATLTAAKMKRKGGPSRGAARPPVFARKHSGGALRPGETVHGFILDTIESLPDIRVTAYSFHHTASPAARYIHFDTDDTNNAFVTGFRTPPSNSRGTTHVLEHLVLCGSKRFPGRDPFFAMTRRSLATYMNALTGPDYTLYPFSTTNAADYQNLLRVYLDAIYAPLLRPRDFAQEAHRLEPVASAPTVDAGGNAGEAAASLAAAARLKLNGVVYNEMRGVINEPGRNFVKKLNQHVLPGTHYCHTSGGDPLAIPDLTLEEVRAYHARHYTPANGITTTYGDLDPRPVMALLDKYFRRAARVADATTAVPLSELTQWNRGRVDASHETGPTAAMGDPTKQKRITVAFALPRDGPPTAAGGKSDAAAAQREVVVHEVLEQLLCNGPSAPLQKALIQDSHLGARFAPGTGFDHHKTTAVCAFGVDGARDATTAEEVERVVEKTLRATVASGFDRRRVDGIVFQERLAHLHRTPNFGVNLLIGAAARAVTYTGHGSPDKIASPLPFLQWMRHLDAIAATPEALTQELQRCTLDNGANKVVLAVRADPTFVETYRSDLAAKEAKAAEAVEGGVAAAAQRHAKWSAEQEKARKLQAAVADRTLPTLTHKDIAAKGFVEPDFDHRVGGLHVAQSNATNGLVYIKALVPCSPQVRDALARLNGDGVLYPPDMDALLWWSEAHSLFGAFGAKGLTMEEFDVRWRACCDGFAFSPVMGVLWPRRNKERTLRAGTLVTFRTTPERLDDALALLRTLLKEPQLLLTPSAPGESTIWTGPQAATLRNRLLSRVAARAAGVVNGALGSGHAYALAAARARVSRMGALEDALGGVHLLHTMTRAQRAVVAQQDMADACDAFAAVAPPTTPDAAATELRLSAAPLERLCTERDALVRNLGANVGAARWWCTVGPEDASRVTESIASMMQLGDAADDAAFDIALENDANPVAPEDASLESVAGLTPAVSRLRLPIDTSYGALVARLAPDGEKGKHAPMSAIHPDYPSLRVASQLLKSELLHNDVRERGGAYGAFCTVTDDGIATFASYRDPQPERSIGVFAGSFGRLTSAKRGGPSKKSTMSVETLPVTPKLVDEALLRIFAAVDAPRTPASYGDAFFLHGCTAADRQALRDRQRAVSPQSVVAAVRRWGGALSGTDGVAAAIVSPR